MRPREHEQTFSVLSLKSNPLREESDRKISWE